MPFVDDDGAQAAEPIPPIRLGQHQRQRFRRSDQNRRQSSVLLRPLAARHVASAQAHRPRWLHRGGRNFQAQGGIGSEGFEGRYPQHRQRRRQLVGAARAERARRAECRVGLAKPRGGVNQSALALGEGSPGFALEWERRPAACCEECLCPS